ncbi:endonuclease III [Candidatus Kaiserbacteria bacterium CG10_big_fil_rev_8_21_14_0_10_49_17]|uniref:Endonuclease III n=1 Tax=Candidatus Kaiserbacteria bacterium CG10_big_fil_rev_8_21_14_0_10_49_17 TaxID=1974609 RepID=A0A2M6WEP0_9BACT|nr:MAG: endonuclease III [Candidatus Kaiserbacteria bacterium CG10_big_fil_rev_8_21_14_0_10_49_17]
MSPQKRRVRRERAKEMMRVLKKLYPNPETELIYSSNWELLVAVILSAQCTDKRVNEVTKTLFKKYKTLDDYVHANREEFEHDIKPTGFYRNKAKNILNAAKVLKEEFNGRLPKTITEMLTIPGVARKTANVVLGNAYGIHEGIAVDTHVRRLAIRFDLTDYTDPIRIEKDLMEIIPKEEWPYVNHAMVLYGRYICPARVHECEKHPLTKIYPRAVDIWPKAK